jgi:outer membrane receptor for ferric coprogen and ferric-rhodotorulic acid
MKVSVRVTSALLRASAVATALTLATAAKLRAQVAPAPPPTSPSTPAADSKKPALPPVATTAANPAKPGSTDEIVSLSPFEVVSNFQGYYGANSASATRFNAKLEDLSSAITVMTKERMQDFAMLDLNDVFLYTAGTEGTGTYTDFTVDRNGSVSDNVQLNPQQANRVRGLGPANVSLGNFETISLEVELGAYTP